MSDADAAALAHLGYKQEFKRAFTPLEVFGVSFGLIGLVPSIASVLVYALPNGGPTALVWGWAVCSVFLCFIALAIAELGSAAPTVGGLYYWSHKYASPRWRNIAAWVCGYSNTIAYVAGIAGVDWGCAVQLMAGASIGSNLTFVPSTQQIYGVYVALLICHACIASMTTRLLARLQGVYIVLNLLLCLAIVIAVPAATPKNFRNDAAYAFGGFENLYGWPNGFAFVSSFLAPMWSIGGFDSSLHISEEAVNASIAVPWATIGATSIAGILGWAVNVALSFNMGKDVGTIIASPVGQPMAAILFNSFGQKGTLAIWSIIVFVQFLIGVNMLTVLSRQVFALSRDGALPGSSYLYRINPYTQTPVNCVWFAAFAALLLGLLVFAGPVAAGAIFSLGVVGQYFAYCIPIICRFLGGNGWVPGPFTLGRFGKPVATIAVAWMFFSIIMLLFPSTPEATPQEMNYTVVVFGGWFLICLTYYFFPIYGGRYWFKGPRANIDQHTSAADDGASTSTDGEKASKGNDDT